MSRMTICSDMHTHTLASSHAFSTVGEICAHAAKIGLKAVALTDHGTALPDSPHVWHFGCQDRLPRVIDGVYLLRGAEANITDDGDKLDMTVDHLDYVIASMHWGTYPSTTPAKHTEAWLAMCDNPAVSCLGHTGQTAYLFDYETVVKRCRDTNTLIEINSSSKRVRKGSWKNCETILKLCKKHGTRIVVSSDAHSHWEVGDFDDALSLLEDTGFPEELVVNADWNRFKEYFEI